MQVRYWFLCKLPAKPMPIAVVSDQVILFELEFKQSLCAGKLL